MISNECKVQSGLYNYRRNQGRIELKESSGHTICGNVIKKNKYCDSYKSIFINYVQHPYPPHLDKYINI